MDESQTVYPPALLAFFNGHSEGRRYFDSLDDETQRELLHSGENLEKNLEIMMKKE